MVGDILVAGEYMGRLSGLRIERDPEKAHRLARRAVLLRKRLAKPCAHAPWRASAENDAFRCDTGDIICNRPPVPHAFQRGRNPTTPLAYLTPTALADEINGDTRQRAEARVTTVVARKDAR